MVKSSGRPGFGPKNRLSASLTARLVFLVAVPAVYFVIATAGRKASYLSNHGFPAGRSLLWHVEEFSEDHPTNCTPPAITHFPPDLFTPEQRECGAVLIHVIVCCYLFTLLALVCDDYFVPCIQVMCQKLDMPEDIAGATFMAAAVSSPEFFINVVGTFITEGDIGVGTVVGSAVFNVLAVPACCGLFAKQATQLNWWSLSRDCGIYGLTVVALIATVWDGRIEWYEALVLVLLYTFYILAMYFNVEIGRFMNKCRCNKYRQGYKKIPGNIYQQDGNPGSIKEKNGNVILQYEANGKAQGYEAIKLNGDVEKAQNDSDSYEKEIEEAEVDVCTFPSDAGCIGRVWWLLVRPIAIVLAITIPSCKSDFWKKFYFITFIMCIFWIGVTSYLVAWMITIIGDTLEIPDSVMGLTFLAAGMSVPEAVSSVIVTNQGHGSMGISNSIGSNTFDILLCLGLPWLIKSTLFPVTEGENFVKINSGGLSYSVVSLFTTLFLLYFAFMYNDYKLDYKVGLIFVFIYVVFLIVASLLELNVFFPVNLPVCSKGY